MKPNARVVLFLLLFSTSVVASPTAKVTLRVVDDQGVPVEGAKAVASFENAGGAWQAARIKLEQGLSDRKGVLSASASTYGRVGYGVRKDGYYKTTGHFDGFTDVSGIYGMRRWQPWNPTIEVELRKIRNPIPLIVREVDKTQFPRENRPMGYDLMAGDWVAPFGRGVTADLRVSFNKEYRSMGDFRYQITLTFQNPDDGLIPIRASVSNGSQLLLPHHAPLDGYQAEYMWGEKVKPTNFGSAERGRLGETQFADLNYFFRIRSQRDKQGRLLSSLYGKIDGPIQVGGYYNDKAHFSFLYFLNPTPNDTNLEWDHKTNLAND